jgi:hypothetical protein
VRLTAKQHRQHEERQVFLQAEVPLTEQLEALRDEMRDIKDRLLG